MTLNVVLTSWKYYQTEDAEADICSDVCLDCRLRDTNLIHPIMLLWQILPKI